MFSDGSETMSYQMVEIKVRILYLHVAKLRLLKRSDVPVPVSGAMARYVFISVVLLTVSACAGPPNQ